PRRFQGFRRLPLQVQGQARAVDPASFRRKHEDARSLWRLGRKEALWPDLYGHRPHDLPDRCQGRHSPCVAEGQGRWPRRRGAGRGAGPLSERKYYVTIEPTSPSSAICEGMSLAEAARAVLECPDAEGKARLAHEAAALWRAGALPLAPGELPDRPQRPV